MAWNLFWTDWFQIPLLEAIIQKNSSMLNRSNLSKKRRRDRKKLEKMIKKQLKSKILRKRNRKISSNIKSCHCRKFQKWICCKVIKKNQFSDSMFWNRIPIPEKIIFINPILSYTLKLTWACYRNNSIISHKNNFCLKSHTFWNYYR